MASILSYYYHEDQVGSNRLVTYVNAGTVTNNFSSDYQPYGANYGSNNGSEVMQYTDRMLDPSDNLYYFNARVYDPTIMRFDTKDPPQASTGTCSTCPTRACSGNINSNLYSYASNNPLTNVDPSGDTVVTPQQACVEQCLSRGGTADRCLAECTSPPSGYDWSTCLWCTAVAGGLMTAFVWALLLAGAGAACSVLIGSIIGAGLCLVLVTYALPNAWLGVIGLAGYLSRIACNRLYGCPT